jgi:hypothetical protein
VFGINWLQKIIKALIASLITGILAFSLVSCGDRVVDSQSALRAATPQAIAASILLNVAVLLRFPRQQLFKNYVNH